MTTPKLPPPNRGVMIAALCGGGMKYEIAVQVFDQILADQLRSLQLATWQAAMEYAAAIADDTIVAEYEGVDCYGEKAASAIRSAPQPTTTQED